MPTPFALIAGRRAALLMLLATAVGAHAADVVAGSGRIAAETRAVSDFDAIAVRGPVKLVVRQGAGEALELRADDNVLPLIETTVEAGRHGRTLVIGPRKGHGFRTRNDIVATVDVVRLKALSSTGSGDVLVQSLRTPVLELSLAGSADARFQALTADELAVSIAGSGDLHAVGNAARLKVSIAGSGDVRARELQSDDVSVSIAGSGDAEVTAHRTLKVSIAGSGDVGYHGNPTVKSSIAGSGSVARR